MYSDGKSFLKRASIFFLHLKRGNSPNATTLAELADCSRNTAQRTIDRLREEYGLPIAYDEEKHGYYLLDPHYEPPAFAAGKEELTALLLLRDLAGVIDSEELWNNIDSLWLRYAQSNAKLTQKLEKLVECFSSDLTMIGSLSDLRLPDLLEIASSQAGVEIVYRSPWLEKEDKTYRGRIHKVHFSDGNLYLLFCGDDERQLILNACFIRKLSVLNYDPLEGKHVKVDESWPHGFGIWLGEPMHDVLIKIAAPGSLYFASQIWHGSQEDSWEGSILVRKMKSALSRQLVSRLVSLGSLLIEIQPEQLKQKVLDEAKKLAANLCSGREKRPGGNVEPI